jgi:glucose dehydrogenase
LIAGLVILMLALPTSIAAHWWTRPDRTSVWSALGRTKMLLVAHFTNANDERTQSIARERARDDDWTTFAHDDLRSGFQRRSTGITRSSVAALKRRWMRVLNQRVIASPLVAGGSVYIATDEGTVFALDAASGEVRWQRAIGNSVRMTPALVDGALLVGVYGEFGGSGEKPHGAAFLALDAATGTIRWRTPLPGLVRSEPVVVDGVIYEGLAGGDSFSGCFDGRIVALDQRTGALLPHVWRSTARANNGAGIWGPLSTDGRTIYVGTGNACDEATSGAGDSIVALTPSLSMVWRTSARVPGIEDSDVGGGVAIVGDRAYVAGKSGYFYTLDRGDGRILERHDLNPFARNGGSIGTPTGDGTVLLISSGPKRDPDSAGDSASSVMTAFDANGHPRYQLASAYPVFGYAAFVPGVGFIALDRRLVGFDAATGKQLWSAELGDLAYASPVVVPSGVYAVTNSGDVFAFAPRGEGER